MILFFYVKFMGNLVCKVYGGIDIYQRFRSTWRIYRIREKQLIQGKVATRLEGGSLPSTEPQGWPKQKRRGW